MEFQPLSNHYDAGGGGQGVSKCHMPGNDFPKAKLQADWGRVQLHLIPHLSGEGC